MKHFSLQILCLLIAFALVSFCHSQEVPELRRIGDSEVYSNDQIWQFAEDCEGYIYAASSSGVLVFNGFKWRLIRLPKSALVRSVFKGDDCRIYVGAYQDFGFLDMENRASPKYVSLADTIFRQSEQEIWKIYGDSKGIVFQSFSEVRYYDFKTVRRYIPPTNIMLGNYIDGRFLIPQIGSGIYIFEAGKFRLMKLANPLPQESRVEAFIKSETKNEILIATQRHGLFNIRDGTLYPVTAILNERLKSEQINRVIRHSSGSYVIGTILNGIYVTDEWFDVLYHINRTDGLANNTVLSLFEDSQGNLLAGLDKGMNLIRLNKNTLHYYDSQDAIGVVFDASTVNGNLFLASNKGVFVKNEDNQYQVVEGTQGQAWSLLKVGESLLCGHNSGTFSIDDREINQVSRVTGGWDMVLVNDSTVLQSSYTGLILLKLRNAAWQFDRRITGGEFLIKEFVMSDSLLVGLHPHFGMYILNLSGDFTRVANRNYITQIGGEELNPAISILQVSEVIYMVWPGKFYKLNETEFRLIPEEEFQQMAGNVRCRLKAEEKTLTGPLVAHDTPIHSIGGNQDFQYLVTTQTGYMLSTQDALCADEADYKVLIESVSVNDQPISFSEPAVISLKPTQNHLNIQLQRNPPFASETSSVFKLSSWNEEWLVVPNDGMLEFRNLDDGEYILAISSTGGNMIESLRFEINPHWYESWIGFLLYIGSIGAIFFVALFFNRIKHQRRTQKLLAEQEKEMEAERLRLKNEELEKELIYKSKTLANDAMVLIQKNHMLFEMKTILARHSREEINLELKRQLLKLINKNINNDEYWQIFELNFNEVHEDFFKRLQSRHPNLTSGERRLAAYIRMDLQSKEIAPLFNISTRSVENKRYRLRTRLGLDREQNLKEYIVNF